MGRIARSCGAPVVIALIVVAAATPARATRGAGDAGSRVAAARGGTAAAAAGSYVALAPQRLRAVSDGAVAAHATASVTVSGVAGVPGSGVSAVAVTLTATAESQAGYLTAFAAGTARPTASSLNFPAQRAIANSAVVPVGANGSIAIYNGSAGSTYVLVDVVGYYRAGTAGSAGSFTPSTPKRLLDTRLGARPGPRSTTRLATGAAAGTAVLLNVTATAATAAGYVTVYPDGTARPATSNLNFPAARTIANQVLVRAGPGGRVDLYNGSAGSTQLIVDIVGRYLAGTPSAPGMLGVTTPARLLDTRTTGGPISDGAVRTVAVAGRAGVPAASAAVLINVTVTDARYRAGYLDAAPIETNDPSRTSRMNFTLGQSIAAQMIVPLNQDGSLAIRVGGGSSAQVLVDVLGYVVDGPDVRRGAIKVEVTSGGSGVENVQVDVYAGGSLIAVDGALVSDLPPSSVGYSVCVKGPSIETGRYASECYDDQPWDGETVPQGTDQVVVVGGATHVLSVDLDFGSGSVPTGRLAGRLTSAATGDAVTGAGVAVYKAPGFNDVVARSRTASDGTYQIAGLPSIADYAVCFSTNGITGEVPATGYQSRCYRNQPGPDSGVATSPTPVSVTAEHTTTGIDQALPPGGAIAGRVTAASGGMPLANVRVLVYVSGATQYQSPVGDVRTSSDGSYRVVDLPTETTVTVCFIGADGTGGPSATGYLDACQYPGSGAEGTPVTVSAGSTTTGIDATLASAGGITGTVRGGASGVEFVTVAVFAADGTELVFDNITGADGSYLITGLAPGGYRVCFDPEETGLGYAPQCYRDVAWPRPGGPPASATAVTVRPNVATPGVDATLRSS